MNFSDWYTDRMDVYRAVDITEDNLTSKHRELVLEGSRFVTYSKISFNTPILHLKGSA